MGNPKQLSQNLRQMCKPWLQIPKVPRKPQEACTCHAHDHSQTHDMRHVHFARFSTIWMPIRYEKCVVYSSFLGHRTNSLPIVYNPSNGGLEVSPYSVLGKMSSPIIIHPEQGSII